MKTVRIGVLLGASMLVLGGAAQAADVVAEPTGMDWSGFYLGLHGGWGWADADSEYGNEEANEECEHSGDYAVAKFYVPRGELGCAVDLKPDGGFAGVQGGFNHMFDNGLVLGLEGDYALASLNDSGEAGTGIFNTHVDLEIEQLASIRARLGMAMGQFLPFVTAGWGWAEVDRSTFNPSLERSDKLRQQLAQWLDFGPWSRICHRRALVGQGGIPLL